MTYLTIFSRHKGKEIVYFDSLLCTIRTSKVKLKQENIDILMENLYRKPWKYLFKGNFIQGQENKKLEKKNIV